MGLKHRILVFSMMAFLLPFMAFFFISLKSVDNVLQGLTNSNIESIRELKTKEVRNFLDGLVFRMEKELEAVRWRNVLFKMKSTISSGEKRFVMSDFDKEEVTDFKERHHVNEIFYIDEKKIVFHSLDMEDIISSPIEKMFTAFADFEKVIDQLLKSQIPLAIVQDRDSDRHHYVTGTYILLPVKNPETHAIEGVMAMKLNLVGLNKLLNGHLPNIGPSSSLHLVYQHGKDFFLVNRDLSFSTEEMLEVVSRIRGEESGQTTIETDSGEILFSFSSFKSLGEKFVIFLRVKEVEVFSKVKGLYTFFVIFALCIMILAVGTISYFSNSISLPYFKKMEKAFKELQEQRQLAIKNAYMAGTTQKASFTIHNIKNLLTVVGLGLDKIGMILASKKKTQEEKNQIIDETVESLVERLETSIKIIESQQGHIKSMNNAVAVDVEKIITNLLNDIKMTNPEIHISSVVEVREIFADQNKLFQVLNNLISNAKEAVLENRENSNMALEVNVYDLDGKVKIDVIDSGVGISKDDLEQIGTFGFSTKEDGHGFGLAFCKTTVEEVMHGIFDVFSEGKGKGARFTIVFNKENTGPLDREEGAE